MLQGCLGHATRMLDSCCEDTSTARTYTVAHTLTCHLAAWPIYIGLRSMESRITLQRLFFSQGYTTSDCNETILLTDQCVDVHKALGGRGREHILSTEQWPLQQSWPVAKRVAQS